MLPQGKHLLCGQGLLEKLLDLIHFSPIAIVRTAAVQCVVQLVTTSSLRYYNIYYSFFKKTLIDFFSFAVMKI